MKQTPMFGFGLALCFFQMQTGTGYGAKILATVFMTSKSHKITYELLLQELAKRGHEVTVLTPVPSNSNRTNPREVLSADLLNHFNRKVDMFDMKVKGVSMNPYTMVPMFDAMCRTTYAQPHVIEIMKQKFDLVLFEPFTNECAAGFLYKLNTTFILLSPFSTPTDLVKLLGGPAPPSFIPNLFSTYDNKMNFFQRVHNLVTEVWMGSLQKWYFTPKMEALYRKVLNDSTIPDVETILKNASLALSNSHISLNGARPFMPDIIEVGGMHMRSAKPLPQDLENFAQSSGDHGFIFFSMGSILESKRLPEARRKELLGGFSKLKQKVLWKWEADSMPDLPSNVKLIKWAPQQDILGHEKIRAFITHGGLGSTTEAIYHGVPLIGIPLFGDQHTNIEKFVRQDIARVLDFVSFTAEDIVESVEILIKDPKYHRNAKRVSNIFRDQRDHPLDRAVFWIEYVLRHQGAVHLRSPARDLNFFQYHSLDIIFTFATIASLVLLIVLKCARKACRLCFKESNYKVVSNDKKHN